MNLSRFVLCSAIASSFSLFGGEDMNWNTGVYQSQASYGTTDSQQQGGRYTPTYSYSQTNQPNANASAADQWWQSRQSHYVPTYSQSQSNQPQANYGAADQQWQARQGFSAPTYSYSQQNQPQGSASTPAPQQYPQRVRYQESQYNQYPANYERGYGFSSGQKTTMSEKESPVQDNETDNEMDTSDEHGHEASDGED